jgi:hypothetical protein
MARPLALALAVLAATSGGAAAAPSVKARGGRAPARGVRPAHVPAAVAAARAAAGPSLPPANVSIDVGSVTNAAVNRKFMGCHSGEAGAVAVGEGREAGRGETKEGRAR